MSAKTKADLEKELEQLKAQLAEKMEQEQQEGISQEEHEDALEKLRMKLEGEHEEKLQELKKGLEAEEEKAPAEEPEGIVFKPMSSQSLYSHHHGAISFGHQMPQLEIIKPNGKAMLFKKLSKALAEVKRIEKNGWNDFFKYKYANEGDILDGIRPILAEVGLALWTTIEHEERKGIETYYKGKSNGLKTMTRVKVKFIIGCADTGETIESVYWGEGEDEADKGLYKAYTGATKYFLTKTFLISSGDIIAEEPNDPEADTQRHNDNYRQPNQNAQNGSNQRQNKNGNNNTQNNQNSQKGGDTAPDTGNGKGVQPSKAELLAKWKILAGSEEGFEPFYTKQMGRGVTHKGLDDFLNGEMAKKKPQQEEQPPKETNGDQTPVDTDSMSPEEYLAYVESNLPFDLTDSEKEQILTDARAGKKERH